MLADLAVLAGMVVAVYFPGLLLGLAAKLRGLALWAIAPAISVGVIAASAVGLQLIGIPFHPIALLVVTVILGAIVFGIRLLIKPRPPHHAPQYKTWVLLVGLAAAALTGFIQVARVIGQPNNFSQTYDNIFHLSAIRWILDTSDGSSLTVASMKSALSAGEIYPAAWHDTVASALLLVHADDVVVGQSALIFVVFALVWPAGVLWLANVLTKLTSISVIVISIISLAFSGFPLLLIAFGVIYPNFLGFAFLPIAMALVASALKLGDGILLDPKLAWLGLVLIQPGIGFAHPNAWLTFLAIFCAALFGKTVENFIEAKRVGSFSFVIWLKAAVTLIFICGALAIWIKVRPNDNFWPPIESLPVAGWHWLTNSAGGGKPAVLVSALMILGLILASRKATQRWLILVWLLVGSLWIVGAWRDHGRLREYVVGVFYSDPMRVAALVPIGAVALTALGINGLVNVVNFWLQNHEAKKISRISAATALIAASLVAVFNPAMNYSINDAAKNYRTTNDSPLITTDELDVLNHIDEFVPAGETIAVNPWNGSSLAYPLAGRNTTAKHVLYEIDDDQQVYIDALDEASSDPEVCPVLKRNDVHWALDFGDQEIHYQNHYLPGFDDMSSAPGFVPVYRSGQAVLYRIDSCS